MKHVKVTPSVFKTANGTRELVSIVSVTYTNRRPRVYLWYSADDITVEQLIDEVARKFKVKAVDLQLPLFGLDEEQYHAADYL